MGYIMLKRAIRIELDQCLMELKINLENNYKDLAHDALKQLHEKLETFYQNGSIKENDYKKYKKIADDYSVQLKNYHH